jgi:hypothetical protein
MLEFRNSALSDLVDCAGIEQAATVVRCCHGERLRQLREQKRSALLISWHVGPGLANVCALYRLGIPTLFVVYDRPCRLPPGLEVCSTTGGADNRALALKRAISRLRGGGFVYIAMEGRGESTLEIPFLGRQIRVGRGPAILARLTGSPVIPLLARWEPSGGTICVTVHEPLPLPLCPPQVGVLFEQTLLETAWRWIEAYLRTLPYELSPRILRSLLRAPRITGPLEGTEFRSKEQGGDEAEMAPRKTYVTARHPNDGR